MASAKPDPPEAAAAPSIVRQPSPADDPKLRALEDFIADGGMPVVTEVRDAAPAHHAEPDEIQMVGALGSKSAAGRSDLRNLPSVDLSDLVPRGDAGRAKPH